MFTRALYIISIGLLIASFGKDRAKTRAALVKGLRAFSNILPDFATVLAIVGLVLTFLSPDIVAGLIGQKTGILGMLVTSIAGAITLIPGFVAFPLAKSLLDRGAGVAQIAVFISTLMMVGFVTVPLEIRYFGRRVTFLRNTLAYLFSFIAAFIIGMVVL
ncbi:MAG TPA: permease [Firmicutes bacterium]|nr:permease [Bacillota bacterium]